MHRAVHEVRDQTLREVLQQLLADDPETRSDAYRAISRKLDGKIAEADARSVLDMALHAEFPPMERDWEDPAEKLIMALWHTPYAALIEPAREGYAGAPEGVRRALLTLLAVTNCADGARAFVEVTTAHGWSSVYDRIFWELARNKGQAELLFPALLRPDQPYFAELANVLLGFLQSKSIEPAALRPALDVLRARLGQRMDAAAAMQRSRGVKWRYSERYWEVKYEAGVLLDLVAWIGDDEMLATARRGLVLKDPWLVTFAAVALAARGEDVRAALRLAAASDETRATLWHALAAHGLQALFPAEHATRNAFAAADMVGWLAHPSELGHPPNELELKQIFESDGDEPSVFYVWRFRTRQRPWTAATSGPYPADAPVGPLHGESTFSCFEPWRARTPEGHALQALGTLDAWRAAWAERG